MALPQRTPEEKREYMRVWRAANKERRAEYGRAYKQRNAERDREANKERARQWRQANPGYMDEWRTRDPDRLKEYEKAYSAANAERRREYARQRRSEHPELWTSDDAKRRAKASRERNVERISAYNKANSERNKERCRRWRAANPDAGSRAASIRRARKYGAPIYENINRNEIIERDASTCYLCSQVLSADEIQLEHVVPLSRGGAHSADNLRVSCDPCNRRKGTKLLEEMGLCPAL